MAIDNPALVGDSGWTTDGAARPDIGELRVSRRLSTLRPAFVLARVRRIGMIA